MPLGLGSAPVSASDLFGRTSDLIAAGQAFAATTGNITTLTNANVMVGLQLLAVNLAKNILIYSIICTPVGNAETDVRLHQGNTNTPDANLSASPTILNQNVASLVASLATVKGSPANATTTTTVGSQRGQYAIGANNTQQLLQNGSGLWIPAGSTGFVVAYVKVATAANSAAVTFEWVEF